MAFCIVKDGLLQAKRWPFVKQFIMYWQSVGYDVAVRWRWQAASVVTGHARIVPYMLLVIVLHVVEYFRRVVVFSVRVFVIFIPVIVVYGILLLVG